MRWICPSNSGSLATVNGNAAKCRKNGFRDGRYFFRKVVIALGNSSITSGADLIRSRSFEGAVLGDAIRNSFGEFHSNHEYRRAVVPPTPARPAAAGPPRLRVGGPRARDPREPESS